MGQDENILEKKQKCLLTFRGARKTIHFEMTCSENYDSQFLHWILLQNDHLQAEKPRNTESTQGKRFQYHFKLNPVNHCIYIFSHS